MRNNRRQQFHNNACHFRIKRAQILAALTRLRVNAAQVIARRIAQLHNGANGGIEIVATEVVGHFAHHAMAFTHQDFDQFGGFFLAHVLLEKSCVIGNARQVVHNAPSAVQELVNARQAVFIPQQLFIRRRHEQDVRAARIGTVLHNHVLRRYHVALRLGHNFAVAIKHHALAQQIREGLVEIEHP